MSGQPGLLVVVSGPSGAGKGSICAALVRSDPDVAFSVSCTTRPRRPHERDGEHYFFLSREEFMAWAAGGRFLEWAEYCGNLYGTPLSWVQERLAAGRVVVLDIDTQGAEQVRRAMPDAVFVFVVPPSAAVLRRRLGRRGSETPADVALRLDTAGQELARVRDYGYLVVNRRLDAAVALIRCIMRAERARVARQDTSWLSTFFSRGG